MPRLSTGRIALLRVLAWLVVAGVAAPALAQGDVDWDEYVGEEDPDELLRANQGVLDRILAEDAEEAQQERRYCAKRLPSQMPRTCRVRDVPVPRSQAELYEYFREWITRCVHRSRVDRHMRENDEAILALWEEVEGRESVRVHVHVDTFEFEQDGETCLGVSAMRFDLERQPDETVEETEDEEEPEEARVPIPDGTDPERDREEIREGFDEVVKSQDPDAIDRAARDSADCFSLDTSVTSAWKEMLSKTLLALPLAKLEGRYECLYGALTAGYPVGLAAALLRLPETYVRNRLMYRPSGPMGSDFDCDDLSKRATDFAMLSGYRRMKALGEGRMQAQYDLVRTYVEEHAGEANRRAGPNVHGSVIDVNGDERAHPDLVYLTAWATREVYDIEKPDNPMSPSSFEDCVEAAIEDALE